MELMCLSVWYNICEVLDEEEPPDEKFYHTWKTYTLDVWQRARDTNFEPIEVAVACVIICCKLFYDLAVYSSDILEIYKGKLDQERMVRRVEPTIISKYWQLIPVVRY